MAKLSRSFNVISLFTELAAPYMDEQFSAKRCLNASRIALDVFREFGVEAKPLSVETMAINKVLLEAKAAAGEQDLTAAETAEVAAKGGWMVMIDTEEKDLSLTGWPGHLVITSCGYLIDPSAGQLSRPQRNLYVPAIVKVPLDRDFVQGKSSLLCPLPEGGVLCYKARRADRSFRDLPGFQHSPWNTAVAHKIIRAIRIKLGVNPANERRVGGKNR